MMRLRAAVLAALLAAAPGALRAQEAITAPGAMLRVLDKTMGQSTDLVLRNGEVGAVDSLAVTLDECRYPTENPSGDAFAMVTIHYRSAVDPVFSGWMIASAPALNALDHPRYDVWVLRCMTS